MSILCFEHTAETTDLRAAIHTAILTTTLRHPDYLITRVIVNPADFARIDPAPRPNENIVAGTCQPNHIMVQVELAQPLAAADPSFRISRRRGQLPLGE